MATDGKRLYVANADAFMPSPPGRPGLAALDPASGKRLWFTPSPHLACGWTGGAVCMNGVSAPAHGGARAGVRRRHERSTSRLLDRWTGKVLWEFDTGGRTYRQSTASPPTRRQLRSARAGRRRRHALCDVGLRRRPWRRAHQCAPGFLRGRPVRPCRVFHQALRRQQFVHRAPGLVDGAVGVGGARRRRSWRWRCGRTGRGR